MSLTTTTTILNVSACQQINNTFTMPWWYIPIIIIGLALVFYLIMQRW